MNKQIEHNEWFGPKIEKALGGRGRTLEECEANGVQYLRFSIFHDDPRRVIFVSNYGREITVAIDTHHAHFDHESVETRDDDFKEMLDWLSDLFEGRVCVCTCKSGNVILWTLSTYNLADVKLKDGERIEVIRYPDNGIQEITCS